MQKRRFESKTDTSDDGTDNGSESVDRYERSSERRSASSNSGTKSGTKSSGFKRGNKQRADAKSFASARRVSGTANDDSAQSGTRETRTGASIDADPDVTRGYVDASNASDRDARLAQARALLKQATEEPAPINPPPNIAQTDGRVATPDSVPFADPFEDADPFEAFEQCAPAEEPRGESVYSRSSQRTRKTSAAEINGPKRPQRSLKGRALAFLSRREYSRAELSRKLRPYVEEADSLETLLDGLERDGWLSNARFVESVVHRRASRMGGSRIINELKRHAVGDALIGETADKLAQSETARAQAVWEKKYGVLPETPAERAKQARFLAARGFSGSTIGKILKGGDEDLGDEIIDD